MNEPRLPRGNEWNDVIEALHRFNNVMTTRAHYPENHPAIPRAVSNAADALARVLEIIPELVLDLIDGELVICARPMPELHEHMSMLVNGMERHDIACIVLMRGLEAAEIERVCRALMQPRDARGRVRERTQAELVHVLLRLADIRAGDKVGGEEIQASAFLPAVQRILEHVAHAFANEQLADVRGVRTVARAMVQACAGRTFTLLPRCWSPGSDDQAAHATNVAMMTAALALASGAGDNLAVEITAAAILHDVGTLLGPAAIRGLPEPAIDEAQRGVYKNHPITGAWALLSTGCPPLWVEVALDHHRGVDGRGYPIFETRGKPHELVRTVALASFFDRKRTLLDGRVDDPDEALRQALRLEGSYFGPPLVTRFLRTFGVYPPGTIVELSDRQTAVVTHASPHDALRPHVKIMSGPNAGALADLNHRSGVEGRHDLSITRAILAPLALRDTAEHAALATPAAEAAAAEGAAAERPRRPSAPVPVLVDRPRRNSPLPPIDPTLVDRPRRASAPPQLDPMSELLSRLGGPRAVPVLARADLGGITLDPRASFVLSFVDGATPIDGVIAKSGMARDEVLALLDGLAHVGVILLR